MAIPSFVDQVTLHVTGGNGGHGVASVHREKFKPLGGPDGGNGGHGGDVILRVAADVTTLIDFHHEPHRKATNGAPGAGSNRNGANGEDVHSQPFPTRSCTPNALAPAGNVPTGTGSQCTAPKLPRAGSGGSLPHGSGCSPPSGEANAAR